MKKQYHKSKKGFTIIEVVLVLAIAGLIFLMVFVAFPALQRSQHDTQRTDDLARVQAKLIDWQNNHSNNLPKAGVFKASERITDEETGQMECPESTQADYQACQFVRDYMNAAASQTSTGGVSLDTFKDPSGEYYNIVITENASKGLDKITTKTFENDGLGGSEKPTMTLNLDDGTLQGDLDAYAIFVVPGATCEEDHAKQSTKNNFAVLYRMEGSGVKCVNNGS